MLEDHSSAGRREDFVIDFGTLDFQIPPYVRCFSYFVGAPVIPNLRRVVFGCLGGMKMLTLNDFLCWPGYTPAISNSP